MTSPTLTIGPPVKALELLDPSEKPPPWIHTITAALDGCENNQVAFGKYGQFYGV